jgi:hypothetical protein
MKKYLEVLLDDEGTFHFASGMPLEKKQDPAAFDREFKQLLHDITEFMWQNKNQQVSRAIRMVAMAETLGSAQPYEQVEEFWSLMMFDTIPQYESYAASIKEPYGFNDRKVTRPSVLPSGASVFPASIPPRKRRK